MGQNKKWKRKANKIMGECYRGCDYCKFLNADPYGYEDSCDLKFDFDEECGNLRELRKATKGCVFVDFFDEKMV